MPNVDVESMRAAAATAELQPLSVSAPSAVVATAPPPPDWHAMARADCAALGGMLTGSRLNILLACVPLGVASELLRWPPLLRFCLVGASLPKPRPHCIPILTGMSMVTCSRDGGIAEPWRCLVIAAVLTRLTCSPARVASAHRALLSASMRPASSASVQNLLALVPLALMLGEVTEDLALRFGTAIGALLNVTFGNSVELILSIAVRPQQFCADNAVNQADDR